MLRKNRIKLFDIERKVNEIEGIKEDIKDLLKVINSIPKFTECDVCGCLLNKNTAFKGQSTVELFYGTMGLEGYVNSFANRPVGTPREKIVEHYYCKIHKPKIIIRRKK